MNNPTFKYKETIRKKSVKAALPGVECPRCKGFYNALESWGTISKELRNQTVHHHSKHRYTTRSPNSPNNLWNFGFGNSNDGAKPKAKPLPKPKQVHHNFGFEPQKKKMVPLKMSKVVKKNKP